LLYLAEETNPHIRTPKSRYRILLVDDEPDITLTFEQMLEDEGFEIDSFNDPHVALSNFSAGSYDIALIDFKMPQMNGFDLYRKLKNVDDKVKYCFLTAYGVSYEGLKKNYPGLDADWFIRKPIDTEDLVKEIKSKLNP
jgi:DNA-binding response OmpR family regulator